MTHRRVILAAGISVALAAAACHEDDLFSPAVPQYTGGAMFQRYVSMGNSITAGFQSGGINDSTQQLSYAVVLAGAMGGDRFYYPSLNAPGCPPPYTNIFTGTRLLGATGTTCLFRNANIPPYLSNVAVPSAEVIDILHNGPTPGTNSNPLTQLFLGGRTQAQAMRAAQPTFVSVWIGNNDVLGSVLSAANSGDSTLITPVAMFQAQYQDVIDSVVASGAAAILIGVANVTEIPFVSQGATYWAIKNGLVPGSAFPPTFTVSDNCAPIATGIPGARGDSVLVPFPYGGALLTAASPPNNQAENLDCADTVAAVIVPAELRKIASTVTSYNAFIASAATANDWAYFNPAPALDSLRAIPAQVAPFPAFGQPCSANPFGAAFSCDGFHPSTATHRLIARKLVQTINAKYGSAIPAVP